MFRGKYIVCTLVACLLLMAASRLAAGDEKSGEKIGRQVISNGGNSSSSAGYQSIGTLSQSAVGAGSSESHGLSHGFWQYAAAPCRGICGDANADGLVNVSDAVIMVNYVFLGGGAPQPVLACGDANADGSSNISDAVYILYYVFQGGAAPDDCAADIWAGSSCCEFQRK